jgi:hypothetical protein
MRTGNPPEGERLGPTDLDTRAQNRAIPVDRGPADRSRWGSPHRAATDRYIITTPGPENKSRLTLNFWRRP